MIDPPMDAVVLAGGHSRRLGEDKVVVELAGRRQVDRVVTALESLRGRVLLATGRPGAPMVDVVETVEDRPGLHGPLAGIVAGLEAAGTDLVAVVAVDLVSPSAPLLRALGQEVVATGVVGAVPVVDGRSQHLHGVLRADLAHTLAGVSDRAGDRSVGYAFDRAGVVTVPERRWREWAPGATPDLDIDTPDDLAAARAALDEPPRDR